MKVSWIDGVVYCVNTSVVIEELVVDSHVVIKEVELSVNGLFHVHLRHPVVGQIQRNVAATSTHHNSTSVPNYMIPGTLAGLQSLEGRVLAKHGGPRHCVNMTSLTVARVDYDRQRYQTK